MGMVGVGTYLALFATFTQSTEGRKELSAENLANWKNLKESCIGLWCFNFIDLALAACPYTLA